MTIIDFKDLKCAVCGHEFSGQILRSSYSIGGSDLDFCPSRLGLQTLGLEVSVCPNCYYVSHDIEKPVTDETREFVLSNPVFKEEKWYSNRVTKYRNLMHIALFEERYHDAFIACLKASWAKEAAGSIREPLGSFRLRYEALELFEKYESELLFDNDTKLCLKADLLRRTARFEEVLELVHPAHPISEQMQCILQYQEHLAKERNSRRYSISQAKNWSRENNDKTQNGTESYDKHTKPGILASLRRVSQKLRNCN